MTKQHFFQWCAFFTMVSWSINWLNGISFQNIQLSCEVLFLRFSICKSIHSCLLQGASMKLPHLLKGKIGLPICSLSFSYCKGLGSKTNHQESWPRTINLKLWMTKWQRQQIISDTKTSPLRARVRWSTIWCPKQN